MKILYIGAAIATVVASASIYLFMIAKDDAVQEDGSTSSQGAPATESKQAPVASSPSPLKAGVYQTYSDAAYAEAKGTRVLFFHAPWCSQCRALDKDIVEQAELAQDVTIFKVDYDTATELRKKYDVTLQTTLVRVDQDGAKVRNYVAYDRPTYQNMVYELGL
ncbi:hypothetical protein A2707_04955 [Candidatus Saccharibacteria bacterium RIFCSPHIGHO2_01_FULL_45_15]|nr:MAG: hypothetical protein A2707_04955 [Candidatus Saccharibacteria bacterium RIFCSPHIGHO2_01_FULL_45_15]OGL28613.1 MAG: hypothetical protein A3C39_04785 [Candidatus Saccharibacteria bacterium RIFCSPHIGHO2_02_FULL_46_12]OGL32682.1 MAG: hypothetical protein A3E76_05010 [Candidatus Saccharibacteria bacterium RIFCSPHIGHO2_12_FULL_44_22]